MNDLTPVEERFRMANPIPDPANPPMTARTAATALLDLEERRGIMQTVEKPQPEPRAPKSRRWIVAAGAAVVAVVAAAGIALWFGSTDGDGGEVADQPATDAAPPAGDPTITFDATTLTCSYSGPTEFPLGVDATFTGVNDSDVPVDMRVVALQDGYTLEDVGDQLQNPRYIVIGTETGLRFPDDAANPTFSRLGRGVIEGTIPDDAGTWFIACESYPAADGPEFSHAVTTFEVVPGS